MYILLNKNNKVVEIRKDIPSYYSDNLILAEVKSLPEKYDYLIAENIREETETWTAIKEEYDANGEIVTSEVEQSRTYIACDLVAKFRPEPTAEQLERQKEKKHDELSKKLIAQKYSLEDENKIMRKYLANPEDETVKANFIKYNEDIEKCITKAKKEIFGE